MEVRLYSEDPDNGFLPSIGTLERLRLPQNVRVDSGVREGDAVTPFYDPMIAKVIAHDATREIGNVERMCFVRIEGEPLIGRLRSRTQ